MAREESAFDANGRAIVCHGVQWWIINRAGQRVGDRYSLVRKWDDDLYFVQRGVRENLMRADGSLVLADWPHRVFRGHGACFMISNTLRKSKTNPKTRYLYGLAHVNGDVLFPIIYECMRWEEACGAFYAELDGKPYFLFCDGRRFDPSHEDEPQQPVDESKDYMEKMVNWVLPGLQFFYRDTDASIDATATYAVGQVFRAGFFVDMTTKLLRPKHRLRFLVASAHAAMLHEIEELCANSPNVAEWNLCVLHQDSYLKVMDVYEREGVTQVFMLHIPPSSLQLWGIAEAAVKFISKSEEEDFDLVQLARKSLDEKLTQPIHTRSLDAEFCERMHHPIGVDRDFQPVSLDIVPTQEGDELHGLSTFIHKLANDADICLSSPGPKDGFPFDGVKDSICEGCIYAAGIREEAEGCGRLFKRSFRNNYLKGTCDHRKTSLEQPSKMEQRAKKEWLAKKERESKESHAYALQLLRKFVRERLGGNLKRLKDYDLNQLVYDPEFGFTSPESSVRDDDSKLIMAVLSLVFAEVWPGLTYQSLEERRYRPDIINITSTIFGLNWYDRYPTIDEYQIEGELRERIVRFCRRCNTIRNVMVVPFGMHLHRNTMALGRGYCDVFLREFWKVMTWEKKINRDVLTALELKRKEEATFRTEENFLRIVRGLFLDDFLENDRPRLVFRGLMSFNSGFSREEYLAACVEFLDFCEHFVDKRADRIIKSLARYV